MIPKLVAATLAALFLVPTLALAWSGKGGWEPDTIQDKNGGWMYVDADTTTVGSAPGKIYLNGLGALVIGYLPSVTTGVNPNSGIAQTGIPTYPDSPKALLGVWKDCNRDGFIGLGDQGLFEYRATLLLDTSVCPANVGTRPVLHNDGLWIHEFVPIGYRNNHGAPLPSDHILIVDNGSRVWLDDGLPGAPPTGTCYTGVFPVGTFLTVGGMISALDCYLTNRVDQTGTNAFCNPPVSSCATWSQIKATENPWGRENGGSRVDVWDCPAGSVVSQDITNYPFALHRPKVPPTVNSAGSPAGTANATGSGLTKKCTPHYDTGKVNPGRDLAHAPYSRETENVTNEVLVKVQSEFTLRFTESYRGCIHTWPACASQVGQNVPDDLGTGSNVFGRSMWGYPSVRGASRNPFVDRTLIAPQSVTNYTYYAYVSPSTLTTYNLALPKGASVTGTYGEEACGASIGQTVVKNGWQCNGDLWYPPGDETTREEYLGSDPNDPRKGLIIGRRPGQPYNLRDIDCYDFSTSTLGKAGVHYGVVTGTKCLRP